MLYADGSGPIPPELELLKFIDRFGAQAVVGRQLGAVEMRRMVYAENVVQAVRRLRSAKSWRELESKEPQVFNLATWALKAVYG